MCEAKFLVLVADDAAKSFEYKEAFVGILIAKEGVSKHADFKSTLFR